MADNDNGMPEAHTTPPSRGQKILELAVYVMGAMLIAGVFILIGGILWKATRRGEAPPQETRLIDVDMSASALAAIDLDGDRIALRGAQEIVVIDTRKGAIVARIRLKP